MTQHAFPRFDEVLVHDPAVDALMAAHVALMLSQSPAESCHVMTADVLRASGARVFAGRDATGRVVAIGAFKPLADDAAELKSMHCAAALRGQGLGRALLEHLRAEARAAEPAAPLAGNRLGALFQPLRAHFTFPKDLFLASPSARMRPDPWSVFMTCEL